MTAGPAANGARSRDVLRLLAGHRRAVAGTAALSLAASALGLAQPLLVRETVAAATAGRSLWTNVAALVALFVVQAAAQTVVRYALARTGEGIVLDVRLRLIDRLLRLRMPVYDRHRVGDLISRAGADAAVLRRAVADGFTNALTGAIGLVATVGLMLWLDWVLFLLVAALTALAVCTVVPALRRMRDVSLHDRRATGEMTADLERALGAIRTVRAAGAQRRESARIAARAADAHAANLRLARYDAALAPAGELAVTGSFLVVLLVGGVRVAAGDVSVADLVAFLLYMVYLTAPLGVLFEAVSAVQQGTGAVHRVDEVLALPVEDVPPAAPPARPARPPGAGPAAGPVLEFRDVWFSYTPGRPVLRGVSFTVPPRGHTALIGRSGAGKTTVFALVECFYEPDRGRVLLHGADVRDGDHRPRIGLVEQDNPVLHGTLRDNLRYAVPDAADADVRAVLEPAGLTGLVARLPEGLDTPVGEHGAALSGGERQRIAIGRALLARPDLLLLDEPTAHLDAASEQALRRALDRISAHCAVLTIAHRRTTIRAAARVVVLHDGVVAASGTHDELARTCPHYRALVDVRHDIGAR